MSIVTNKHGPMLRRIRIPVDLFGNHLTQPSIFGEPLSGNAADRMPANFDRAKRPVHDRVRDRDDIGLMTETRRMFESQFSLVEVLLAA